MPAVLTTFSGVPRLLAVVTKDVASITAATTSDVSFTVAGSQPNQCYVCLAPSLETGLTISHAWCATAGTVKVRMGNVTVGNIDPASQDYQFYGF